MTDPKIGKQSSLPTSAKPTDTETPSPASGSSEAAVLEGQTQPTEQPGGMIGEGRATGPVEEVTEKAPRSALEGGMIDEGS